MTSTIYKEIHILKLIIKSTALGDHLCLDDITILSILHQPDISDLAYFVLKAIFPDPVPEQLRLYPNT